MASMTVDRPSAQPAWRQRLHDELQASDQRAIALARGLTVEQLNWKPRPESWSVGQCLEHLCIANEVYLPPIAKALDARSPSPVQDITPGWLGRRFIRDYIDPSTQKRPHQAPGKIAPASRVDASVLDRFLRSNEAARDLVLGIGVTFGVGYGLSSPRAPIAPNPRVCYWGGWGGSLVVNDVDARMTMAYVMNRMGQGTVGDDRAHRILRAVYDSIE